MSIYIGRTPAKAMFEEGSIKKIKTLLRTRCKIYLYNQINNFRDPQKTCARSKFSSQASHIGTVVSVLEIKTARSRKKNCKSEIPVCLEHKVMPYSN